ncbi:MAG: hypothetical protein L6R38_001206 [Xanthoria sp. 2 TBL-2021]|nr:MAG: hypothetical protein L6R38_001206 [Xanthoria sp. 2 TBL-2021]
MSDSYGSPNQVKAFTQVQSPEEELKSGYDEDGKDADFTCVDRDAKQAIEEWIQQRHTFHPPSFIPIRQAAKDLSEVSCYPTLGIDATFPQHRATSDHETFAPAQAEYPVWYFLYGYSQKTEEISQRHGLQFNVSRQEGRQGKEELKMDLP